MLYLKSKKQKNINLINVINDSRIIIIIIGVKGVGSNPPDE